MRIGSRPAGSLRFRRGGLAVAALLALVAGRGAAHAAPTPDPGFPYVDANCDHAFDPADGDVGRATGVDLLAIVLAHGRFATGEPVDGYVPPPAPACLVWPASVKLKTRARAALELDADVHLVLRGTLDVGAGAVTLTAGAHLEVDGATITGRDDLTLTAGDDDPADGALTAANAKIRSRHGSVYLSATTRIAASRSDVRALGDIVVYDDNVAPGPIDLERAKLRATAGLVDVYAAFAYEPPPAPPPGDVTVRVSDAKLGGLAVSLVTLGGAILADRARIQGSRDDSVLFDSAGGLVSLDDAHVTRAGSIDVWTWVEPENPVQQSRIRAEGARLRAESGVAFDVGCSGRSEHGPSDLLAAGVSVTATDGATLATYSHTDPGFIDVRGARLAVNGGYPSDLMVAIYDDGHASTIDARGAQVRDPVLPTFFAETVLGDPTPNSPDLAWAPDGLVLTELSDTELEADWTIENLGPREAAPGAEIAFFWSDDAAFDAGDLYLGSTTVPAMVAGRGGEANGVVTLTVPDEELKYVVAIVDVANLVHELNEENNRYAARRPYLDLGFYAAATGLEIHMTSATEGVVDWIVRNFGQLAAPESIEVDFHLSMDAVLDPSDTLLGTRVLPDPLVGETNLHGSETFTGLPPEGLFFVIATVDARDAVAELFETNNRRTVGVGPNLTVGYLDGHYLESQETLVIQIRVENDGRRPAIGPIAVSYALDQFSGGQRPLRTTSFMDLAANTSHTETIEVFVPIAESQGSVTAHVDSADAIAEVDEIDNGLSAPVRRQP